MDSMTRLARPQAFSRQMARAAAELRSIMSKGQSPTGNGRLSVRSVEVAEPSEYDAGRLKDLRVSLNLSQAAFARIMGVSDVLVRSWERGVRRPALMARRLLDQVREHPDQFIKLMRTAPHLSAAARKRAGKQAA
jgi:putative transcriptional regulator